MRGARWEEGVGAGKASAHVCSSILGLGHSRVCPEPLAA